MEYIKKFHYKTSFVSFNIIPHTQSDFIKFAKIMKENEKLKKVYLKIYLGYYYLYKRNENEILRCVKEIVKLRNLGKIILEISSKERMKKIENFVRD